MNRQIEGKFESNLSGDAEIEMPVSSALDVPHGRTDGTSGGSGAKSQKAALAVRRCRHPIPIFSRDAMQYECSEAGGKESEAATRETLLARGGRCQTPFVSVTSISRRRVPWLNVP